MIHARARRFFFNWLLPFISKTCLFLDVVLATAGYALEFRWLRNRIKSVDPNLTGWFVCLICYFPFHGMMEEFLPSRSGAPAIWAETVWGRRSLLLGVVCCQALWLIPTLCLGFRAANLTNRGIIGFGPYRWIRHPQYAFRILWILIDTLPYLRHVGAVLWALIMLGLYALRCVTEERHLVADSDYVAYCSQVKYRLLSRVW